MEMLILGHAITMLLPTLIPLAFMMKYFSKQRSVRLSKLSQGDVAFIERLITGYMVSMREL